MLKVCSFMPAVTQMIYDMGLQDHLQGITFECPSRALEDHPPVVRCVLEGQNMSSKEIDIVFSESKNKGKQLYYVDESLLEAIDPDIIFTQDVCDICQIDTACTSAVIEKLGLKPNLISITPDALNDVFQNAITIAEALGAREAATAYLNALKKRMGKVAHLQTAFALKPREVMLIEWIDPIYNCGHWIPHQIAHAGGVDRLSNPGGNSTVIQWERILACDPEILIIAPCGFKVTRSMDEMHLLKEHRGWERLKAVRNNAVYVVDYELFTQSSAATLVDGIELLAGLFHPDYIEIPQSLEGRYRNFI